MRNAFPPDFWTNGCEAGVEVGPAPRGACYPANAIKTALWPISRPFWNPCELGLSTAITVQLDCEKLRLRPNTHGWLAA
ncbi:hypothetical protein CDAR_549041 [Caerostris darwini]|uniref:Uncharacterized protein n=1 Tax=Caerostris darwini TaxID=1538125 RepID=A0AAV4WIE9_9ARAC|nr:hypothetical protein CDAR_549041 [Caerostris darwini]